MKTRKTAGSAIEVWLAPWLDPSIDRAAMTADLRALDPERAKRFKRGGLAGHAPAAAVRDLVGPKVWNSYFKFTVERSPWDRVISLWRWRQHQRQTTVSFDDFLSAMESGDAAQQRQSHADDWSNWPIYTLDDRVAVDRVIRFEDLIGGLTAALHTVGIGFSGELPRLKSGFRRAEDAPAALAPAHKKRIAALFSREIAEFGYVEP